MHALLVKTRRALLGLACALLLAAAPAAAHDVAKAVDSVSITVSDLDRSLAFYEDVLGFEKISEVEVEGDAYQHLMGVFGLRMRVARLRLGDEFIELVEVMTPRGRPIPVDSRSNDGWFQHVAIIVSDMARAFAWLREHDITYASPAPQRLPDWNPNARGIEAFYLEGPDGNNLEILAFPEGKGDPKWHRPSGKLFLGIDHTAIVVADTDASLAFYRDRLGMQVAGESENFGRSRNGSIMCSARISGSRRCAHPTARVSSSWNTSRRAMAGPFRPILGRAICGTGRSTSRPGASTASPTIGICV